MAAFLEPLAQNSLLPSASASYSATLDARPAPYVGITAHAAVTISEKTWARAALLPASAVAAAAAAGVVLARRQRKQRCTALSRCAEATDIERPAAASQPSSRRQVVALLGAAGLAATNVAPATAKVGEGDELPAGAKQEDRIRIALSKWQELGEKTMKGEVKEEADWQNTQGFLRRLYSLAPDMDYLADGLREDKKEKAKDIAVKFKKEVKLMDKPAKAQDVEKFMAMHKEVTDYMEAYLDLLNDIPAELLSATGAEEDVVLS
eukprot:TRINITY_DN12968_c0_g1_i1.p2 TRINITY_DN12968_c0_g1~~TRINITY_DN12968_c0_g1_i1.p2  ORF type:complete len:286 (+),score=83.95 TRINITY_DN12968_c0_g1_i1:68-859(+)